MKISIWFDSYLGMKPEDIFAFSSPPMHKKGENSTRYRVDVEIPDCDALAYGELVEVKE